MSDLDLVVTVRGPNGAVVRRLGGPRVEIGRAPENDVVLDHPAVSGAHARLLRRGAGFVVVDDGSAGGTWLGETRLGAEPLPVQSGDALRVGPFTVELFLDAGQGFTTDTRDSAVLADAILDERALGRVGGYQLAVLTGPAAGRLIPLTPAAPCWLGARADCAVPIAGVAPRHVEVRRDRRGGVIATAHAPGARLSGRPLRAPVALLVGERIQIADVFVELRGPPNPGPAAWTRGERLGVALAALALGAAAALLVW